jgi:hypothetical protein
MTDEERELLIEQAAAAWRPTRFGVAGEDDAVGWHAAWHDLDADGRKEAFRRATAMRQWEAALDPDGLSTTAKAVLARIAKR